MTKPTTTPSPSTVSLADEEGVKRIVTDTQFGLCATVNNLSRLVAPGGIGTVLESMMIWQLLQVRHLEETPLIFAGPMWKGLVEWTRAQMLRIGFELCGAKDLEIPRCVDGGDAAIEIIREHHARWQLKQGKGA